MFKTREAIQGGGGWIPSEIRRVVNPYDQVQKKGERLLASPRFFAAFGFSLEGDTPTDLDYSQRYPLVVALTVRMARRNRPAATVLLVNTVVQGITDLTTDYPPGLLRWLTFRDHLSIGFVFAPLQATLVCLVPGITERQRRFLLLLPLGLIMLNALSNPENGRAATGGGPG